MFSLTSTLGFNLLVTLGGRYKVDPVKEFGEGSSCDEQSHSTASGWSFPWPWTA